MRESLDVEAQRYFEDCVSIEKLESLGVDYLMASQERDVLSTENEEPFDWPVETDSDSVLYHADRQEVPQRPDHWRKSSSQNFGESLLVGKAAGKTKDCVPLDDEGMCLPWLEWEPEVDTLNRKEQVEKVSCFNHFFLFWLHSHNIASTWTTSCSGWKVMLPIEIDMFLRDQGSYQL